MRRIIMVALGLLSLTGCVLVTSVEHDGLETTVIDAETRQPLAEAFVYDGFAYGDDEKGQPRVLSKSNASGQIRLAPRTHLEFVIFLGEAVVHQSLWVCKDGYKPVWVGGRGGWNADLSPKKYFKPGTIELTRSTLIATESCLQVSEADEGRPHEQSEPSTEK